MESPENIVPELLGWKRFAKRVIEVVAANPKKAVAATTAIGLLVGVYIDPQIANAVIAVAQVVGLLL